MYKVLSYTIKKDSPVWPGSPKLEIEQRMKISETCNANTYMVSLYNHAGTHFDAPNHYYAEGKKITEIPIESFIYEKPLVLDIPKGAKEKITKLDIEKYSKDIKECDMIMFRTGYSKIREEDPLAYVNEGPAIGSDVAIFLMENFTNIKALAVDFISLACPLDTKDGDLAHQHLLGKFHDHYICIIEDVNMEEVDKNKLQKVMALPIFVEDVDSFPVTVIAQER